MSKRRRTITKLERQMKLRARPAKASNYLHSLDSYLRKHPDIQVIIYERVSAGEPARRNNLTVQDIVLLGVVKKRHLPVIRVFREIGPGWVKHDDRLVLIEAIKLAKQQSKKTIILALMANRFLRHEYYTPTTPYLPDDTEWKIVKDWAGDIELITFLEPDMPESEVRSRHIKWGLQTKNPRGGRPKSRKAGYKKRIKDKKSPQALKLYQQGIAIRGISKLIDAPESTIKDWVTKHDDEQK